MLVVLHLPGIALQNQGIDVGIHLLERAAIDEDRAPGLGGGRLRARRTLQPDRSPIQIDELNLAYARTDEIIVALDRLAVISRCGRIAHERGVTSSDRLLLLLV